MKELFEKTSNKSIFNYITDTVNYKNANECANYNPPFISYIPIGVPQRNIDVDTVLKGIDQYLTKCTEYKYRGKIDLKNVKIDEKKECK